MSNSSLSLTELTQTIFSFNSGVMLAALASLLLVVLFVVLLHAYAHCFFPHRRRPPTVTVSYILGPARVSHFGSVEFGAPTKGLDPSAISAIPLFVYEAERRRKAAVECVICLSEFEEREIGRRMPKCGHSFHLECIDMWLSSHSNCPVCRAPVVCESSEAKPQEETAESGGGNGVEIVIEEQNQRANGEAVDGGGSSSSDSSVSPPLMYCLKRMMSRMKSEGRIFPAS